MKFTLVLIILLLPLTVLAHGLEPELDAEAGTLPGSPGYLLERVGEWIEVNLLTLSTKQKQAKKLRFASERVAELRALTVKENPKTRHLQTTLRRYREFLREAEDMAEKIIFLDGAEVEIAERFEETTRLHEQLILELLEGAETEFSAGLREALAAARIENKNIFIYMAEKYQFNGADIRKHQLIVQRHVVMVQNRLVDAPEEKVKKTEEFLAEAKKFKEAGLNVQAYEFVEKAKNVVY